MRVRERANELIEVSESTALIEKICGGRPQVFRAVSAAIDQSCGGATSISDELTANFGDEFEAVSIDDCCLLRLSAEN
jgi:hypothetical protein